MGKTKNQELITLRTAVILLFAAVAGLVVGELTYMAERPLPTAVLAGLSAAASSLFGAHHLIGHDG